MNQFQKSIAEKQAIKEAKRSFKQTPTVINTLKHSIERIEKKPILDGLMENENTLDWNYPIYIDRIYLLEFVDKTYLVYNSLISGYANTVKAAINKEGSIRCINIRSCNLLARNLL